MRQVWKIGIAGQWTRFTVLIMISLCAGVITAAQPVLTGMVIQSVEQESSRSTTTLCFILIGVFLTESVLQFGIAFFSGKTGEDFIYSLRQHSIRLISNLQLGVKQNLEHADLHSRVLTDTALANSVFIGTIPRAVNTLMLSVGCIVGMLITIPTLFAVIVFIFAVTSGIAFLISKLLKKQYSKNRADSVQLSATLWQIINSLPAFKAKNAEPWILNRFSNAAGEARDSATRVDVTAGLLMPVLNIGTQACIIVALLLTATGTARGELTSSQSTMFLMFLLYSVSPLVELGSMASTASSGLASIERLKVLWELQLERSDGQAIERLTPPTVLKFNNTGYSFPDSDYPVIEKFNAELKGPGIYLLRGPNGRGKSTLLHLANGTYPSSGIISIGDHEISQVALSSWRDNVLLIPQDREPISGTLRDNLGAGGNYTDSQRIQAIQTSGFSKHYTDLDLPISGDTGIDLSGGQRALLALSDAILRNPPILLLDEITAGIDKETLPHIRNLLSRMGENHLIVAVSHDDSLSDLARGEITLPIESTVKI